MTSANGDSNQLNQNNNTHPSTSEYFYTIRPTQPSDLSQLSDVERSAAALFTSIPGLSHLADDETMSVDAHQGVLEKWRLWRMNVGDEDGKLGGGSWVVVARRDDHVLRADIGAAAGDDEEIAGFVITELLPVTRSLDHPTTGSQTEPTEAESYFLHINELSIHTSHQRRGLARRLLSTVKNFAVTLSAHPHPSDRTPHDGLSDSAVQPTPRLNIPGLSLTTFQDVPFNAPFYKKFGFQEVEREDIEGIIGIEGMRIWRHDCERFEGEDVGALGMRKRCWMICWF